MSDFSPKLYRIHSFHVLFTYGLCWTQLKYNTNTNGFSWIFKDTYFPKNRLLHLHYNNLIKLFYVWLSSFCGVRLWQSSYVQVLGHTKVTHYSKNILLNALCVFSISLRRFLLYWYLQAILAMSFWQVY